MKAFPGKEEIGDCGLFEHHAGMDLRDYFAAKAMQAIIIGMKGTVEGEILEAVNNIPVAAYDMADMMMKEREK